MMIMPFICSCILTHFQPLPSTHSGTKANTNVNTAVSGVPNPIHSNYETTVSGVRIVSLYPDPLRCDCVQRDAGHTVDLLQTLPGDVVVALFKTFSS
jgi:hypothetical protein